MEITFFVTGDLNIMQRDTGLGGSESALLDAIYILNKKGHKVKILNTKYDHIIDGIEHIDFTKRDFQRDNYEVFISQRCPAVFTEYLKAKCKILWMHDNGHDDLYRFYKNIDKIFVISNWQKHIQQNWYKHPHWTENIIIPDEYFYLTRLGVMLDKIMKYRIINKINNQFIYTPNPGRGLDFLFKIWPEIKIKDKKLLVLADKENHRDLYNLSKQLEGIEWIGRKNKEDMFFFLAQSYLMLYPSTFWETFCNCIIEAQATLTPPISIEHSAIPETIEKAGYLVRPDNNTINNFSAIVEKLYLIPQEYKMIQRICEEKIKKHDWNVIIDEWIEEFQRIMS